MNYITVTIYFLVTQATTNKAIPMIQNDKLILMNSLINVLLPKRNENKILNHF